jgi:hypothetical protein
MPFSDMPRPPQPDPSSQPDIVIEQRLTPAEAAYLLNDSVQDIARSASAAQAERERIQRQTSPGRNTPPTSGR